MKPYPILAALATSVLLAACGGGGDLFDASCDDQREDLVKQAGAPEEIKHYDAGDYHSWTYWYWSRGTSRTFTWGGSNDRCNISDYTFSPIR